MKKGLILFDIDGVLIKERIKLKDGTPFVRYYSVAVKKVFDISVDINQIETSGKTDAGILLELLELGGVSRSEGIRHMKKLIDTCCTWVKKHINEADIHVQEGVENLLKELKNTGCVLGLVTGNLKKIAEIKLKKVNLLDFFDVGSFGEVSEIRSKLIKGAIKRADSKFDIDKESIFYFGDSPRDIKAGKEAGVKVVAVATGNYSKEELEKYQPDITFNNLVDTHFIISSLGIK